MIRTVYGLVACAVWILSAGGYLLRRKAIVLCYHGITDQQRSMFENQMARMRGRVIPAHHAEQTRSGRGRPLIGLTFDDAFANLIPNAMPSISAFSLPVTIFAVADNLGRPPCWTMPVWHPDRSEPVMTSEMLRTLSATPGVVIGSHTLTHLPLDRVGADVLRRELRESMERLQALTGAPITELAFPHGAWNDEVVETAHAAGYDRVYTLEHDLEPSRFGQGVVSRFSVSPDLSPIEFRLLIDGAYFWLGSVRRSLRRFRSNARTDHTTSPMKAAL